MDNIVIFQNPDADQWPLKRPELSGCWQTHRYYIYNRYFTTKITYYVFLIPEKIDAYADSITK